jgi:streptomycin 6-kinase
MYYQFRPEELQKITDRFDSNFFETLLLNLEKFSDKWMLRDLQFIPYYSVNCVFTCYSEIHGNSILKLGIPNKETITECNALKEYNGKRFCRIFDFDDENGAILLERIMPGIPLRNEKSLEKRIDVFCSMYKGLHIKSENDEKYPTYNGWVSRIAGYMNGRPDSKELCEHMKKANDLCCEISEKYNRRLLLHGDFHHDNILLGSNGYVIIDPKGVIGDPVFDIPRFILNEINDTDMETFNTVNTILAALGEKLEFPADVLSKCLYIETVMAQCWSVEVGSSEEEYPVQLRYADFAEALLKKVN